MMPVLRVEDITDYLPREYTEADRQAVSRTDPTVDGPPSEVVGWLAPVRVWVPCTDLPTTPMCTDEECTGQCSPDTPAFWHRAESPLAVGDVVHLAQPCPDCHGKGWHPIKAWSGRTMMHSDDRCIASGCDDGVVVGASAVVAEILPVGPSVLEPPGIRYNPENTLLVESATSWVTLSGDWSGAGWGVRVTEVTPL